MDFETVGADEFGASLRGLGLNLVVRDVRRHVQLLTEIMGAEAFQVTDDFAIITYEGHILQLHADHTYEKNPLLGVLSAVDTRGPGVEIHFFDTDPDAAVALAEAHGLEILQPPTDKPHGLREAFIIAPDGFVWVPSRPLEAAS